jgi:serine/threonine-protein kinase
MTPAQGESMIQVGQTIAHYRIQGWIASSGSGELYRAEDMRSRRTVALRVVPADVVADTEERGRFLRIAKAASGLDHPNFCAVTDIKESEDGRLFVAMMCYDGETVREKLARGPLSVETAIAIAQQLAEGLVVAHENDIIHGHLDPTSIMVTGDGVVKILDFGLPHYTAPQRSDANTPDYRSPEQMRGNYPDERSDIWSFGLIVYEMLTGVMPVRGAHLLNRLPTLITDNLRLASDLRPEIPGSMAHLCKLCLAFDSRNRPHDMMEVQSLLGHWPFEVSAEGQRDWNKVRGWYIVAAVGGAILLTGLAIYLLAR